MPEGLSETRHVADVASALSGQNMCLIQDELSAADLLDYYKFMKELEHRHCRSVDVQTRPLRPVDADWEASVENTNIYAQPDATIGGPAWCSDMIWTHNPETETSLDSAREHAACTSAKAQYNALCRASRENHLQQAGPVPCSNCRASMAVLQPPILFDCRPRARTHCLGDPDDIPLIRGTYPVAWLLCDKLLDCCGNKSLTSSGGNIHAR